MSSDNTRGRIEDAVAALEFTVAEIDKHLDESRSLMEARLLRNDDNSERISAVAAQIEEDFLRLSKIKESKLIPKNTFEKHTLMLEGITDKLDGLISGVMRMRDRDRSTFMESGQSAPIDPKQVTGIEAKLDYIEKLILDIAPRMSAEREFETESNEEKASKISKNLENKQQYSAREVMGVGLLGMFFGAIISKIIF